VVVTGARSIDAGWRNATLDAMKFFVKAVVTGFALSLGSAIFKKVQRKIGLGEDTKAAADVIKQDGATDPNLTDRLS
jgi:hypothetical protein